MYGVPHQEILNRYKSIGARILRTDEEGAIEITADGSDIMIRTAREESPSH
jgi:competence protein ComEC